VLRARGQPSPSRASGSQPVDGASSMTPKSTSLATSRRASNRGIALTSRRVSIVEIPSMRESTKPDSGSSERLLSSWSGTTSRGIRSVGGSGLGSAGAGAGTVGRSEGVSRRRICGNRPSGYRSSSNGGGSVRRSSSSSETPSSPNDSHGECEAERPALWIRPKLKLASSPCAGTQTQSFWRVGRGHLPLCGDFSRGRMTYRPNWLGRYAGASHLCTYGMLSPNLLRSSPREVAGRYRGLRCSSQIAYMVVPSSD
jgi:hypothetical protein